MKEKLFSGSAEKDGFYVSRTDDTNSVSTLMRILDEMENPTKSPRFLPAAGPERLIIIYKTRLLRELLMHRRINFWEIKKILMREEPIKFNIEIYRRACSQVLEDLGIKF
jgi:hypothetical protein